MYNEFPESSTKLRDAYEKQIQVEIANPPNVTVHRMKTQLAAIQIVQMLESLFPESSTKLRGAISSIV